MRKTHIALGVAAALGAAGTASAADWVLTDLAVKSSNGSSSLVLSGDLNFSNGPGNSLVADGAFGGTAYVGPNALMTYDFGAGTTMSGAGTVSGSFTCTEGAFGGFVGASICGNYNFGTNYANESTVNPDGSNRVIGGDDNALGPAQSIADFAGYVPVIPPTDFMTILKFENGDATSGSTWTFEAVAVPVPAAVWLFGSALGLLGWARRRSV